MNDFIAYLQELFDDFGAVSARAMFGGYGLYRDGVIIGLVIDDGLYLKVDGQTQALFEAQGCAPFVYTQMARPVTIELLVGTRGRAGFAAGDAAVGAARARGRVAQAEGSQARIQEGDETPGQAAGGENTAPLALSRDLPATLIAGRRRSAPGRSADVP